MAAISGKLLRVKVGDKYISCQQDATLNLTNTYEEEDPCKPDGTTPETSKTWITRDSAEAVQDWNVSVSAKAFLDILAGASLHQGDILKLVVDGDLDVEVEFLSTAGQHTNPANMLFSGDGVIENFTLNAPVTGSATYDLTVLGNGKPTVTMLPSA